MKRIICLITALCLIFGSFSFCFGVDWSSTDQQNLSNAASRLYYMNQSAAYYLYNISNNTNNIYNKTVDIYNALFNNGHNITYWIQSISTWMSPIYTAITSMPSDLWVIQSLLGYPTTDSGGTTWHPYVKEFMDVFNNQQVYGSWDFILGANGGITYRGNPTYNFVTVVNDHLNDIKELFVQAYNYNYLYSANNYNASQNAVNWANLGTSTFTPVSVADGTFKWLSAIQAPVARLSYVLASDERIEAQQDAAANEEAVVDNFIDSTGDGSASPSDIGSISDLSSGYKSNFGSDASVSGIFNIFNSNNMGWFSQETVNQLDTTTPTRRGSSFDTPLLDQQIRDIYDQIGVVND